jgi:hypothetical protein
MAKQVWLLFISPVSLATIDDRCNFAINLPAGQFCRLFFWLRHALPEALPVLELRSSEDLYDRV